MTKKDNSLKSINWLKPAPKDRVFHVSPNGDLNSITAARDAIRNLPESQRHAHPIRVLIHGGTYFLDEPLIFTPEDSGTTTAPIIYQAAPGERPRISGGRRLTGWQESMKNNRRLWTVQLPEVKSGRWTFTQLFVDGRRCQRARLPETGFYLLTNVKPGPDTRTGSFRKGDLKNWHNLKDVEVIAPHYWLDSHLRIESLDSKSNSVTFTTPGARPLDDELRRGACRYWIENVREGMLVPGQWYLDRCSGVLSYLPLDHEKLGQVEVIAPCLESLISLEGKGNKNIIPEFSNPGCQNVTIEAPPSRPDILKHIKKISAQAVHDLHFVGINFAHVEWDYSLGNPGDKQAAFNVPGAICLHHAHHCSLRLNRIGRIAGYAVEIGYGCHHIEVVANQLDDLGAGGIKVGHGSHFSHVADNSIRHGGRRFPSAIGIWIGHSGDNTVVHNLVYDFFYTAISVGWIWGYRPSMARRNCIEYNHLYKIGQNMLSDMGGVYSLGVSPGTTVSHNLIHDIRCFGYGGNGLYPDEGTSFIHYDGNVVYNTDSGNIHMNYGRDDLFRNNIFVNGRDSQVAWGTPKNFRPLRLENNIIQWHEGAPVVGNWFAGMPLAEFSGNVYWHEAGHEPDFTGHSWAQWQERGFDPDGIIADPLLADAEDGCPALRADSPAFTRGFRPIDTRVMGTRLDVQASGNAPTPSETCGPLVWTSIESPEPLQEGAKYEDRYIQYPESTPCNFVMHAVFENAGDETFRGGVNFSVSPASAVEGPASVSMELDLPPGARISLPLTLAVRDGADEIVLRTASDNPGFESSVLGLGFRPAIRIPKLPAEMAARDYPAALSRAPIMPVDYGCLSLGSIRIGLSGESMAFYAEVNDSNIERIDPIFKGSMIDLFGFGSSGKGNAGQVANALGQVFLGPEGSGRPAVLATTGMEPIPGGDLFFELTDNGYRIAARIPLEALQISISNGEFGFKAAIYSHAPGATGILRAHLFNERQRTDIHAYGRMIISD